MAENFPKLMTRHQNRSRKIRENKVGRKKKECIYKNYTLTHHIHSAKNQRQKYVKLLVVLSSAFPCSLLGIHPTATRKEIKSQTLIKLEDPLGPEPQQVKGIHYQ